MTDTAEPQTQPSQQNAQAQQPQQSSQQSKHMMTPREKKWIVYDVGNSAFVLLSTAVVPIYANSLLKAAGETNIVSTWGYAQTIASLVIAVLMPLLGSIADVQGMKIRFFIGFFLTGVVMCCAMAMPLGWLAFIIVYVLATIGLNGSLTFYDSMLVDTTSNERMDRISSHGYAWGYIGSTVPFIVCIALIFGGPALFGWSTTACTRASFVITALWWVAFTIPLLTSYKQVHYRATAGQAGEAIRGTFAELGSTFRAIRKNKPLWMFMIAFFFYIDAVNTVISMSTSYGTQLGIDSTQLVVALLVTQFVAFPCSIIYGKLAGRFGSKTMITAAVVAYMCIVFFAAFFLRAALEFPLVLRQDHSEGPCQRVLRLLRYFRQDGVDYRHVPRRYHDVADWQRVDRRAVDSHSAGRRARLPASAEGSDQGFDGSRNRRLTAAVRQRSARQRSLDSIPPDNRRSAECAVPACGKPRRPAQLRQLPSGMLYWHRLHTVAQRSAAPAMTQREVNDVIGK